MTAFLKGPQKLDVAIQSVRGLAVQARFTKPIITAAYRIFQEPIVKSPVIELKPGEQVRIIVTLPPDIPIDAEFVHLQPALLPQEGSSRADQITQTSIVKEEGDVIKTYSVDISAPATSTVLTARFEEGDVFWTFTNPLIENRYDMPDIAEQTNQYLDAMQQTHGDIDTPIELPFLIESNTATRVSIGLFAIEYVRVKTQSWFNELDGTERVDRNLSLDFAQVETIPVNSLVDDAGEKLMELHLDIGGEFGQERLLGSTQRHGDIEQMMTINDDFAIAQGIHLDTEIKCVGVCALLQIEAETEIYTEIQTDTNGMPATSSPMVQTTTQLSASLDQANINWAFIPFESPVDLRPNETYWVIFRGVQGVGRLAMQAQAGTYLTRMLINRGGQMWRPAQAKEDSVIPMLRCVYLPDIDNQAAAITLGLEGTDIQRPIDPQPQSQHILFQIAETIDSPVRLVIQSHAKGALSLANLIQKFNVLP